jgi:hypothetical protein
MKYKILIDGKNLSEELMMSDFTIYLLLDQTQNYYQKKFQQA